MSDARQVFITYDGGPANGTEDQPVYCPSCRSQMATIVHGDTPRRTCPSCRFVWHKNPAPAVSVLVVDGDRFLLCRRRSGGFQSGKWCLPCGYVEFHEDFLSAARREVKEEAGLDVDIQAILSVVSNFFTPAIHTLVAVLLAAPIGGDARAGDDVDQVQWCSPTDDFPEFAFEADRHIVERYFRTRLTGAPVDTRYARPHAGKP